MTLEEILRSDHPLVTEYNEKYDKASIDEVFAQCKKEDPEAIYELSARYRCGVDGVEKDVLKAEKLLWKVLEYQRHAKALYDLGRIYLYDLEGKEQEGIDCLEAGSSLGSGRCSEALGIYYEEKDGPSERAETCYRIAVQQGCARAYATLGSLYYVEEHYECARENFEKGIEQGDSRAYLQLAKMYYNQTGIDFDLERMLELFQKAHEMGELDASYLLGRMYYNGIFVEEDNEKAFGYLKEASDRGYRKANGILGTMYGFGQGVKKDVELALQYLDRASEEERATAYNMKGRILAAEHRFEEAKEALEQAREMGDEAASKLLETIQNAERQDTSWINNADINELEKRYAEGDKRVLFPIAYAYETGTKGATMDIGKAKALYETIIQWDSEVLGSAHACNNLAGILLDGKGGYSDPEEAFRLANKSMEYTKTEYAYFLLVQMYALGKGIPKDEAKSFQLLMEAAENLHVGWAYERMARGYLSGEMGAPKQDIALAVEYIRELLKIQPDNVFANGIMGQFYWHGLETAGCQIQPNEEMAVRHFTAANTADAYVKLGDMYSEDRKFFKPALALEYYQKAWEMGDALGASGIVSLQLTSDFEGQPWRDKKKGVEAGKYYLENGKDNGLKQVVLQCIVMYLAHGLGEKERDYAEQEYLYLFYKMGSWRLSYVDAQAHARTQAALENILENVFTVYTKLPLRDAEKKLLDMLKQVERYCEKNSYLKELCTDFLGRKYCSMGCAYTYGNLQNYARAKELIEQAAWYGNADAENLLKRFRVTLFGQLIFK